MKRVWLTLWAVMVFVSACATETYPILIPSAEEPTEQNPAATGGKSRAGRPLPGNQWRQLDAQ